MKRREHLIDEFVDRNRDVYLHSDSPQEETMTFHRTWALLEITDFTQAFICRKTDISPFVHSGAENRSLQAARPADERRRSRIGIDASILNLF